MRKKWKMGKLVAKQIPFKAAKLETKSKTRVTDTMRGESEGDFKVKLKEDGMKLCRGIEKRNGIRRNQIKSKLNNNDQERKRKTKTKKQKSQMKHVGREKVTKRRIKEERNDLNL